ncbi:FtsZ-binding cell division protein ZapB [Pseudomonas sp. BE134]|nr:FtsZ-binding cell division protein ZapB [Pseudomonas sp. BE134]
MEMRLDDLELLPSPRQLQIEDLQQLRESLLRERREVQQHNQTLQQDLQALRLKTEQESYVRGVRIARTAG